VLYLEAAMSRQALASGNFSTNELVPIPSVHPYELTCGAWFFQVVDADT